jgi:hypothetical protein
MQICVNSHLTLIIVDPNVKASARHYENITWYPGKGIVDRRKQGYIDGRLGPTMVNVYLLTITLMVMRIPCSIPKLQLQLLFTTSGKLASEVSVLL